jgi:glutamate 5-kinase
LFTADPSSDPGATLIGRVERINETIESYASGPAEGGRGGMVTKISAARLATAGGTDVVLASGLEPDAIVRIAEGEPLGTIFPAGSSRLESRKRWLLSGMSIRGGVVVDDGATRALQERNTSLLPAGVREVRGAFERGETIEVLAPDGRRIACGVSNYSSGEMQRLAGAKSAQIATILGYDYGSEAVHRDNLVLV